MVKAPTPVKETFAVELAFSAGAVTVCVPPPPPQMEEALEFPLMSAVGGAWPGQWEQTCRLYCDHSAALIKCSSFLNEGVKTLNVHQDRITGSPDHCWRSWCCAFCHRLPPNSPYITVTLGNHHLKWVNFNSKAISCRSTRTHKHIWSTVAETKLAISHWYWFPSFFTSIFK